MTVLQSWIPDICVRVLRESLGMPRPAKRAVMLLLDAGLVLLSVWLAFYLRLGSWSYRIGNEWFAVALALGALPIFWIFDLYRAIFRHIGVYALVGLARACFIYGILYAGIFTFLGVTGVPRTVGLIQPILLFLLVVASRTGLRAISGGLEERRRATRVLIYGAGASGRQLAGAIAGSGGLHLVGFVDDDPTLHGAILDGRRIYGSENLGPLIADKEVTDVLLAMPSVSHYQRNKIIERLRPLSMRVRTVPDLLDLASGRLELSSIRPLDIQDLLGRDCADPDPILFSRNILRKTVLVTGAGGSIGSELCRQILAARPDTLLIVELSEYALYSIDKELRTLLGPEPVTKIVPLLASVRDARRIERIMKAWRPDTVYHAAAYKHVPLVEHNPIEGVLNNVFGTFHCVRAAIAAGVSDFVLVSTDKAVRPTNIMGASKRLAELVLQALAAQGCKTCLSMVRFGNVLGSSGSVVPLFNAQIAAGGPVTITHEEVTRYFMTIPEAAQLVIQSGAMAVGGEVFILDMGEPVRIIDLARKMVELSGLTVRGEANPTGDIPIEIVGLRPGEKLYEELLIGGNPLPTAHQKIMMAREEFHTWPHLEDILSDLTIAIDEADLEAVYRLIKDAVPEFAPTGEIVDWISMKETVADEWRRSDFRSLRANRLDAAGRRSES